MRKKWEDEEVIKRIERKKYTIEFVKQENLDEDIDKLHRILARLLYEDALLSKANS